MFRSMSFNGTLDPMGKVQIPKFLQEAATVPSAEISLLLELLSLATCTALRFESLPTYYWSLSTPPPNTHTPASISFMIHFMIQMNSPEDRGHALHSSGSAAW